MLRRGVKRIKSKKAQLGLGGIVMMVMIIFVCLALINETFNQQTHMTTKNAVANEAISLSTARLAGSGGINITTSNFTIREDPTGTWKATECPVTINAYGNATADWTENTDYVWYGSKGTLQVLNTSTTIQLGNSTLIDYTYCEDGYNVDSGSRGIAGIIGLFAVIALFIIIAGFAGREWMS